jgi:hypothetical protein
MTPSEGAIHLPSHSESHTPNSDIAFSPVNGSNENLPSTNDWQMVEDNVGLLEENSIPVGERTTRDRSRGWRRFLQNIISSFRASLTPYVTGERSVRDTLYQYRYMIGFFAISWITGIVLWHFKRQVFEALENLSHAVEGMGVGCVSLFASLIPQYANVVSKLNCCWTHTCLTYLQWLCFDWLLNFPQRFSSNDRIWHLSDSVRIHIWLLARIPTIVFWCFSWKCCVLLPKSPMAQEKSYQNDVQVPQT